MRKKEHKDISEALRHYYITGIVGLILSFFSVSFLLEYVVPATKLVEDTLKESFALKFIVSFLLTYIIIKIHRVINYYRYVKAQAIIAEGAFLTYYKKNSSTAQIKDAENDLREKARHAESIRILGASGFRTFGETSSPLFEAVRNCSELFVMMLYPTGEGIKKRVESLLAGKQENFSQDDIDRELNNYQEEIKKSIITLKQIYSRNQSVKLGFYDEEPLLKILIIDHKMIWLQHYESGIHVRELPTYFLEKEEAEAGTGLFKAILDIFNRKWKYVENHLYDFEQDRIWNPRTGQYESFS